MSGAAAARAGGWPGRALRGRHLAALWGPRLRGLPGGPPAMGPRPWAPGAGGGRQAGGAGGRRRGARPAATTRSSLGPRGSAWCSSSSSPTARRSCSPRWRSRARPSPSTAAAEPSRAATAAAAAEVASDTLACVYVGNLPAAVAGDQRRVAELVRPHVGEVRDVRVQVDPATRRSTGCAFVDVAIPGGEGAGAGPGSAWAAALRASAAAELGLPGGAALDVRVVDPQFLRHVPADKPRRAAEVVGPRPGAAGDLYVGNLPRDVVAADLVRVFGNFGAVEDVRIATSPKGRLLGFAYVTMADGAEAEAAVRKLRDYVWDGFPVHIRRTEAGGGNGGKNR